LAAGALAYACAWGLGQVLPTRRLPVQMVQVLVSGGLGVLAYYLLALALRIKEVRQAARDVLGRVRLG